MARAGLNETNPAETRYSYRRIGIFDKGRMMTEVSGTKRSESEDDGSGYISRLTQKDEEVVKRVRHSRKVDSYPDQSGH